MVNTLRITSVVAVIVAGLVLVLVVGPKDLAPKVLAGFALQTDDATLRILDEPGAVKKWRTRNGDTKAVEPDTPILVQQAELLKDILVPKVTPAPTGRTRREIERPTRRPTPKPTGSAKFDLVGTSYEPANPKGSFAYIYVKGDNTYQWVQVGDEIGHYTVKEVKPDAVICFDGREDVEIAVKATVGTSSIVEGDAKTASTEVSPAVSTQNDPESNPFAGRQADSPRITGRAAPDPWRQSGPATNPGAAALRERAEKNRRARELVDRMRAPGAKLDDRAAHVKRLISEFKSSQVGPNEARKVEDLGRELNESR